MFWNFESGIVSQIDTLLEKEDVTLKELLEEDDIIQECKAENKNLLEFLCKPEILMEMIEMVTKEPEDMDDIKKKFKYPNIVCELLTSDVSSINESLVSNPEILDKLINFLNNDSVLNPLLASFFSKIFCLLIIKKTEAMIEFFKSKPAIIDLILKHIETSAVMDLLLKFLTGIENQQWRNSIITWLREESLVPKMIDVFKKDGHTDDQQVNCGQFICDMIKASRENQSLLQEESTGDPLLDQLESTDTITNLLNNMFETRTEVALVHGMSILQSLLEYKRYCANIQQPVAGPSGIGTSGLTAGSSSSGSSSTNQSKNPSNPDGEEFEGIPQCIADAQQPVFSKSEIPDSVSKLDAERLSKSVRQVHSAVVKKLFEFNLILEDPPVKPSIVTSVGIIHVPLGSCRLEVAHLIRALISSNNPEINHKLYHLQTINKLLQLFFEYPWNNFLHTQVEQSIKSILNNIKKTSPVTTPISDQDMKTADGDDTSVDDDQKTSSDPETAAVLLVKQLFQESQIISRILNVWDTINSDDILKSDEKMIDDETGVTTVQTTFHRKPRPGYMGHLIKIANHIVDSGTEDTVKQLIQNNDRFDDWNSFVNTTLSEINKRIQTPLVADVLSNNYDDAQKQDSALQQAFIEYQMASMTRALCTQIGNFNTSDLTELDDLPIQSHADQLSKINFNLAEVVKNSAALYNTSASSSQLMKDHSSQDDEDNKNLSDDEDNKNSSDDDDLWADKDDDPTVIRSFPASSTNSNPGDFIPHDADVTTPDDTTVVNMDIDNTTGGWTVLGSGTAASESAMETGDPWGSGATDNDTSTSNSGANEAWANFDSQDHLTSSTSVEKS